jgi:hypothetical protein
VVSYSERTKKKTLYWLVFGCDINCVLGFFFMDCLLMGLFSLALAHAYDDLRCSCELDEFLDLVEDLKQTLSSCRAVAESVVTPTTVGSSFENGNGGGGCGSGGGGGGGGSPSESGGDGGAYGEDATQFGVAAARAGGRGAGAITRAFFMAADADGE